MIKLNIRQLFQLLTIYYHNLLYTVSLLINNNFYVFVDALDISEMLEESFKDKCKSKPVEIDQIHRLAVGAGNLLHLKTALLPLGLVK